MQFGPYASSFYGKNFTMINTDCNIETDEIGEKWLMSLELKGGISANFDIDKAIIDPSYNKWFKQWAKEQLEKWRKESENIRYC
jgi:hypothetical protein